MRQRKGETPARYFSGPAARTVFSSVYASQPRRQIDRSTLRPRATATHQATILAQLPVRHTLKDVGIVESFNKRFRQHACGRL